MNEFLTSNEAKWRLARTIVQGIIGVLIANLDTLVGFAPIPTTVKPIIVALVMACLSPLMAYIGGNELGIDTYRENCDFVEWTEDEGDDVSTVPDSTIED